MTAMTTSAVATGYGDPKVTGSPEGQWLEVSGVLDIDGDPVRVTLLYAEADRRLYPTAAKIEADGREDRNFICTAATVTLHARSLFPVVDGLEYDIRDAFDPDGTVVVRDSLLAAIEAFGREIAYRVVAASR